MDDRWSASTVPAPLRPARVEPDAVDDTKDDVSAVAGVGGTVVAMSSYTFKVDGYGVGDRLLEGVMFDVTVDADTLTVTDVAADPRSKAYFEQLNTTMWLAKIRDDADDTLDDIRASGHAVEILTDLNDDGTLEF